MSDFIKVMTPPFRMSYPHLFKPYSMDNNEPKFQLTMLFPKGADLKALIKAADQSMTAKWGQRPKKFKSPFLDGDEMEQESFHGTTFIRTATKEMPSIINGRKEEVIESHLVKAGFWARATVNPYCWTFKSKKGVSFGLLNVQLLPLDFVIDFYKSQKLDYDFVEEPFTSRTTADQDFDEVDDPGEDPSNYDNGNVEDDDDTDDDFM